MSPLPRRPPRADIVVVLRWAKADGEVRNLERRLESTLGLADRQCDGCRRRLPARLLAKVRNGQELTPCPRCRRLLYGAAWLEPDAKPVALRAVTREDP